MDPKNYKLYHIFEPGLKKASSNTPCSDRDFTVYMNTPTHGFGPIKMTLDLYGPTRTEGDSVDPASTQEEDPSN